MDFKILLETLINNVIFKLLLLLILTDIIFGILRAIKQKQLNSDIGLDGLIRKGSVILSVAAFSIADSLVHLNLIAFLPIDITNVLGVKQIGMTEFIAVICILMEAISVVENLQTLGVPIPNWVSKVLSDTNKKIQNKSNEIE